MGGAQVCDLNVRNMGNTFDLGGIECRVAVFQQLACLELSVLLVEQMVLE